MPIVSTEILKELFIKQDINGITIDTSIFENYQYGFEFGVLSKLEQFSRSDAHFILADIIKHEMQSHLLKKADEIQKNIKENFPPLGNTWGVTKEDRTKILENIFNNLTPEAITDERINNFIDETSAEIINCGDFVKSSDLIDLYINTRPPFSAKEAKKREFPDAIALLALEEWCNKNSTKIVATSKDGDWKTFCENSNNLYFINDLSSALSVFQADADDTSNLLRRLLENEEINYIENEILDSIKQQSDSIDIDIEANSSFYYEANLNSIELEPSLPILEQIKDFEVIDFEDSVLTIQSKIAFNLTTIIDASFEQWDSIDREYVGIGSAEISHEEDIDLDVIIQIYFENGTIKIQDVEVLELGISIDFGEIEPDFD